MTEPTDSRKQRMWNLRIIGACVVLITFVAGWWFWRNAGPYGSLRAEVRSIGVDRLQSWAVSVLDNPPTEFGAGPEGTLRPDEIPADIRPLAQGFVVYRPGQPDIGSEEHILFACGGGFYHYGLRVGRPGYQPLPDRQFHFEKLGDGVWGMRER